MKWLAIPTLTAAIAWSSILQWSHPDWTNRRLLIELPRQHLGIGLLALLGVAFLLIDAYMESKKP